MQFKKIISTLFIIHYSLFILFGCGYKPSTAFSKKVLGDKIYVDLDINIEEPENSVFIKDAINEAIYNRFKAQLTNKKDANTIIKVKLEEVELTPLSYDKNGYATLYKNSVELDFKVIDRFKKSYKITSKGTFSFGVVGQSVISDKKKFDAIKVASSKAIDKFISKISYYGCKKSMEKKQCN